MALLSFETSGTTYPTTERHFPADLNPQKHRCENLKPRASATSLFERYGNFSDTFVMRII
jgi:hypothetical protein